MAEQVRGWRSQFMKCLDGPTGWGLIITFLMLFFLPYFLPSNSVESLGSYPALSAIPVMLAAFLRGRKGSLVASGVIASSLAVINTRQFGIEWPARDLHAWLFGNLGILIFGLTAGQFRQMMRTIASAHAELAEAHVTIQHQALTDSLTELPNRRALSDHLERELDRARRFGRSLGVVFFDGDRFKRINDMYGHAVGDAVLQELGERVQTVMRGGDMLGRYGGEEFVVILPEIDHDQIVSIVERMRARVAALPVATGLVKGGVTVTISLGFACFPVDGTTGAELITKADQAMYWAKRLGRNQARSATETRRLQREMPPEVLSLDEREYNDEITTAQARRADEAGIIYSLMGVLELRDVGTSAHSHAVSDLATAIARELELDEERVREVAAAGLLHAIGKVGLPDTLFNKPGRLSPTEWDVMHQHPAMGAAILEGSVYLRALIPAVRHHLERWDGAGYPDQLVGEQIPLAARILAIAVAFVAMTTDRPYRAARSPSAAAAEIANFAGCQFDPAIAAAAQIVFVRQSVEAAQREATKRQLAA